MEVSQLVGCSRGIFYVVLLHEGSKDFLSLLLCLTIVTSQDGLYLRLGLGR